MGLQVPHRHGGQTMLVDSEALELDRQIKYGDPVSGWRGDETMFVCIQPDVGGMGPPSVQVWGLDAHNREYVAAATPAYDGWRQRLLIKLVQGDWQKRAGDLVEDTIANNRKIAEDRHARWQDWLENEAAPKLRWALQRDGYGTRDDHYFPAKTKKDSDA